MQEFHLETASEPKVSVLCLYLPERRPHAAGRRLGGSQYGHVDQGNPFHHIVRLYSFYPLSVKAQ